MKKLALILSAYILVLTAMPCLDLPKNNILRKIEITRGTNCNHPNDVDPCSPFCVCNCCGHHIGFIENIVLSAIFSFAGKQVFRYIPVLKFNPDHSIWQPPELS